MKKLNRDIASHFNESPCDILKSSSDRDAYYISTTFIPTMRIKQWKPLDPATMSSNLAYCYLEQKDPAVNFNCTKDAFSNPDFLKHVFPNNEQDITRPIATEKCVLAIDPNNIQPDALNHFWHKMGHNECQTMVTTFATSNAKLESEISKHTDTLISLTHTLNQNAETISAKRKTLQDLNADVYDLKVANRNLQTACNEQAELNVIYTKNLADLTASCSSTVNNLSAYNTTCINNLTYWTAEHEKKTAKYTTKKPIYEKQQVKYNTNKMALSNLMQQYTNLVENKKQLDTNFVIENNNNIKCQDEKATCLRLYAGCLSSDASAIAQGSNYNRNWQDCLTTLAQCTTSNKSCTADLIQLETKNKATVSNYQVCQNSLEACNDQLANDTTTLKGIQKQIKLWKDTHVNCSQYPPIIEGLKIAIQDILAWCRFPMDAALQNQQAYNDALALGVQSVSDQVAACEAGQDQLPTTIPPREIADTMPERGEGPPDFDKVEKLTKARLYKGTNFSGTPVLLEKGKYQGDQMGMPNDTLQSIELPVGWTAKIWEGDFNRGSFTTTQSEKDLRAIATSMGWDTNNGYSAITAIELY